MQPFTPEQSALALRLATMYRDDLSNLAIDVTPGAGDTYHRRWTREQAIRRILEVLTDVPNGTPEDADRRSYVLEKLSVQTVGNAASVQA